MQKLERAEIGWALLNAVGIGSFLLIASTFFWIEPEVADIPGANVGNAFGWIIYAAPIATAFSVANIGRLVFAIISRRGARGLVSALMICCWVAALLIDNAHHGI